MFKNKTRLSTFFSQSFRSIKKCFSFFATSHFLQTSLLDIFPTGRLFFSWMNWFCVCQAIWLNRDHLQNFCHLEFALLSLRPFPWPSFIVVTYLEVQLVVSILNRELLLCVVVDVLCPMNSKEKKIHRSVPPLRKTSSKSWLLRRKNAGETISMHGLFYLHDVIGIASIQRDGLIHQKLIDIFNCFENSSNSFFIIFTVKKQCDYKNK